MTAEVIEPLAISLSMVALWAMLGFAVWISARERGRRADRQAETVSRLIDKPGTSQEAMAYLDSVSGRKLLESVMTLVAIAVVAAIAAGALGSALPTLLSRLPELSVVSTVAGIGRHVSLAGATVVASAALAFLLLALTGLLTRAED